MAERSGMTHFNQKGEARMVDVGEKAVSHREAVAQGRIVMSPETLELIERGASKKGDVLAIARIAGIMAAKKTPDLVPLCHPVALTHVSIEFESEHSTDSTASIVCRATTRTTERTGVEMEALTAVQVALLTIYDMCKATDRGMEMHEIRLNHKSGGKSGEWNRD